MFYKLKAFCLLLCTLSASAAVISDSGESRRDLSLEKRAPSGFIYTSGQQFFLDGHPFFFMGTNAYWADTISNGDLNSLFSQMNSAGMKVLRIFGWGDNVGSPNDGSFQSWSGNYNTPNPNAFAAHMDPIVNAAESHGIKLVVPMIGNWGPSINLYIQQILGSKATHDTFYSNSQLINAYKRYVNFFVNRYKNSPAIMAWELMNEPRCQGDDNRGQSSACNTQLITNWVSEISSYIKSLDPYHLITVGDEGWFNTEAGFGNGWQYDGSEGIDWEANLKLWSIDYGTVHLYPDTWGLSLDWGNTWISQHGQISESVAKPVVLEEFGTTNTAARYSTLQGWLNTAVDNLYGGMQYWQFVGSFPSGYNSPNDGNGISTSESSYGLVKSSAGTQNYYSGGGVRQWAQCGGSGWIGTTYCMSGYSCVYQNEYWSRCQ